MASMHRDGILEGVRSTDFDDLNRLCSGQTHGLPAAALDRLEANGWVESFGKTYLITIVGRALLESSRFQRDLASENIKPHPIAHRTMPGPQAG